MLILSGNLTRFLLFIALFFLRNEKHLFASKEIHGWLEKLFVLIIVW